MTNKILISPIKTEIDYENALNRVDELWGSEVETLKGDELDILITLIEKYEEQHYPILPPDPIEAIKFRMEQMEITKSDLGKIIGSNRVSEILNKKRKMSLNIIKKLSKYLNISVDLLIN